MSQVEANKIAGMEAGSASQVTVLVGPSRKFVLTYTMLIFVFS